MPTALGGVWPGRSRKLRRGTLGLSTHWPLDGCAGVTQDNQYHSRGKRWGCAHSTHRKGTYTHKMQSFRKGGLSPQYPHRKERIRVHRIQKGETAVFTVPRDWGWHGPIGRPHSRTERLHSAPQGLDSLVLTGVDELHQNQLLHVLMEDVFQRAAPLLPQPRPELLQRTRARESPRWKGGSAVWLVLNGQTLPS